MKQVPEVAHPPTTPPPRPAALRRRARPHAAAPRRHETEAKTMWLPRRHHGGQAKPGRGIELPFVEFFADKPFRLKFNP